MTAYNREKFIGAAMESVLASGYRDFELIVVDDGSSDRTVEIARSFEAADPRVRVYINEKNLGDYKNRNKAASYARGEYLKFLDSDDLIYPYGLGAFVYFMESDPEAAMGISFKRNISHLPFPWVMEPSVSVRHHFFSESFLDCGPTGTIIRRACFEALGGYSGKRMIGDLEFGLKTAGRYKIMLVPPALIFWRSHDEQELAYGIKHNLYAEMTGTMVSEQFAGFPPGVLTDGEKTAILQRLVRTDRIEHYKRTIKKLIRWGK